MRRLDKRILDAQIEVFLEWGRRRNIIPPDYREWLELFAIHSVKTDILDVDDSDIDPFMELVYSKVYNTITREKARKAIEQMIRYYAARNRNGQAQLTKGRPPHISEIAKTQNYRKMGLPLRDIAKLMGKNLSLIHRWTKYPLQGREDSVIPR